MKIKISFLFAFLTSLLLVVSCKKDAFLAEVNTAVNIDGAIKTYPVSLQEAKLIYEQQVNPQEAMGSSVLFYGHPAWFLSYSTKNLNGGDLLVIPLVDSLIYHANQNLVNARLVFFKDSVGKVNSLMSVSVADSTYYQSKNGRVETKDFIGSFQIYSLDGKFKEGFVLDSGQLVNYFTEITLGSPNIDDRAETCVTSITAWEGCTPYAFQGEPCNSPITNDEAGNSYSQSTITLIGPCPPAPGGGVGNPNGNGGTNGTGPGSGGSGSNGPGAGGPPPPTTINPSIYLPSHSVWDVFNGTIPVAICWNSCVPEGMTHAQLVQLVRIKKSFSALGYQLSQDELQWMMDNPGVIQMITDRINSLVEGQSTEELFTYIDDVIRVSALLGLSADGFNLLLNDESFYNNVISFLDSHDDEIGQNSIRQVIEYAADGNAIGAIPFTLLENWSPADEDLSAEIAFNYNYIRLTQPNLPLHYALAAAMYQAFSGEVHTALDICGLVEVMGAPCDLANGVLFFIEGERLDGSLSIAAAIPVIGTNITVVKYVKLASGIIHRVKWKWVAGICNFGTNSSMRTAMRKALDTPTDWQAHHILPLSLKTHEIIQEAAKYPLNPFHINEFGNGINLPENLGLGFPKHIGSHPQYSNRITVDLNKIKPNIPSALTPAEKIDWIARNVRDLMSTIEAEIKSAGGAGTINDVTWNWSPN
jgi:A nuclease family of the HNH/ENDO VII superfamily with conserved AHH